MRERGELLRRGWRVERLGAEAIGVMRTCGLREHSRGRAALTRCDGRWLIVRTGQPSVSSFQAFSLLLSLSLTLFPTSSSRQTNPAAARLSSPTTPSSTRINSLTPARTRFFAISAATPPSKGVMIIRA